MKKTIITIIIFLATSCQVSANNSDDILGIAALSVFDLYTSHKLFKIPGKGELNPVLPQKPSLEQMSSVGAGSLAVLILIDKTIDDCPLKDIFFKSVIATEKFIINDHLEQLDGRRKKRYSFIVIISGEF